jgi:hypothetical protein
MQYCRLSSERVATFVGTFAELRKASVIFVTSVCLSVRKPARNNSAPTGRNLMKFNFLIFFENLPRKIQVSLKSDKNNGYFKWRPVYIMMISSRIHHRMRNVSDKRCTENQNTHFMSNNFFSKSRAVYEIMWKIIVQPDRPQMTIWRMGIVCWISKATDIAENV